MSFKRILLFTLAIVYQVTGVPVGVESSAGLEKGKKVENGTFQRLDGDELHNGHVSDAKAEFIDQRVVEGGRLRLHDGDYHRGKSGSSAQRAVGAGRFRRQFNDFHGDRGMEGRNRRDDDDYDDYYYDYRFGYHKDAKGRVSGQRAPQSKRVRRDDDDDGDDDDDNFHNLFTETK